MMLKIIIGPQGAGQSDILCKEMAESSLAHPSSSFYAVVPEQATLRMQREVVKAHPDQAVMNIDVVSFERLAHRVFQELGVNETDILNDTGKVLILRKILEEAKEELKLYRKKVHMPGFAEEMKSIITELKQYSVHDSDLEKMMESAAGSHNGLLYEKLQDIRLVYSLFNKRIQDSYTTQEEILDVFARLVHRSQLIRDSYIYLDGFTGFTPVQYKLIEELIKYTAGITVTLTLPEDKISGNLTELNQFYLSNRTYNRLCEIAEKTGNQVQIASTGVQTEQIPAKIYNASDIQSEVNFAAREILHGIRNEGKRFRDYAIVLSDMDSYYDVLKNTFLEAGISCFIDYKSKLGDNSLARFLIAAMQLLTDKFSYESIFAFLKSGMTDLTLNEICIIENYSLEFGIKRYRPWNTPFKKNRNVHGKQFWDLDKINSIRSRFMDTVSDFYAKAGGREKSAADFSNALKVLLISNSIEEKMQSKSQFFYDMGDMARGKEYEQVYNLITDLLDQITDLMGSEKLTAREYSDILAGAIDEIKVSIIPPALDAVMIGDLTRTRFDNVKTLFVMGANDGKLPSYHSSQGVLTQKEREFLKKENFELAPTSLESLYNQHFYIYLMLSKPSQTLFITYPSHDEEGAELTASYILESLEDILPGIKKEPASAQHEEMWIRQAARKLSESIGKMQENNLDERNLKLLSFFAESDHEVIRQAISGKFFTNQSLPLDEQTAVDLYGEKLHGSVSRYEKYYECPFKHFLGYGLRIEERPEYEVQATDIGTIYHNSLELYAQRLKEEGLTFRNITDEQSHEIARQCVESAASEMENDVMVSSRRNLYMLQRMIAVTEKTTDVLRSHVRDGLFEPSFYELEFKSEVSDKADFNGKIDRVDIYDSGDIYIKIIDYKSGTKKFSIKDIYTGQQLQLTAYLRAAMNKARELFPDRNVKVGGVYYYLIQDKFVSSEKDAAEKFRMSGITNCEPLALHAVDTTLEEEGSSKIVEISYTSKGLSNHSKIANENEFGKLMDFVDRKIGNVSEKIRQGDVNIAPSYESNEKNACTYCEYKDICKFEAGKWGSDYNKLPDDLTTADMENEIYGRCKMD